MKEKKHMKVKPKTFEKYLVLIFLATLFMSVAFAKISEIRLSVAGTVNAKLQEGLFISNISKTATSGVVLEEVKYYDGTLLSTSIELSTTSSSYITYEISMYNNSAEEYYFTGVTYDANAYDNTNITYTLDGIEEYITTIGSKEEIKFNITFEYKDGITVSSNQTLNSLLNFTFSNEFIEFTVGEEKHTAPKGATWEQFVNSKYNTYGVYITDNKVYTSNNKQLLYTDETNNIIGQEVKKTDVISETLLYIETPTITLDKETITLEIEEGGTAEGTLTGTVDNTNLELTWMVSEDSGITISGEGNTRIITVTKAVENASITVSYGLVSATCRVTVTEKKLPTISDINGNDVQGKVLSTTSNTSVWDRYGNKIVVPAGFKITTDANNVTEGIVIEDCTETETKGSQFVWVPVGTIYTTETESKTITLGRYSNFTKNTDGEYVPATTELDSFYTEGLKDSNTENAHAKDIEAFILSASAEKNGGYYIGRFEAGVSEYDEIRTNNNTQASGDTNWTKYKTTDGEDPQLVCKAGQQVWNYITQKKASELCRNMYTNKPYESDLVNSYAWDTAIIFIQTFGGCEDYYNQNFSTSVNNDKYCNIYDMSGNSQEWSTETYSGLYRALSFSWRVYIIRL